MIDEWRFVEVTVVFASYRPSDILTDTFETMSEVQLRIPS